MNSKTFDLNDKFKTIDTLNQSPIDIHALRFKDLDKNEIPHEVDEDGYLIVHKAKNEEIKKHIIITRGEKGAISINDKNISEVGCKKNLNILDLTGAGDLFASGYLHGYINNFNEIECLIN